MAAYAALVSLMHVLNRVQHPACPVSLDQLQIQSLLDKVSFLVVFLETYPPRVTKMLEGKMIDMAYAAEDIIEFFVIGQIRELYAGDREEADLHYCLGLERAIQETDLIIQESRKLIATSPHNKDQLLTSSVGPSSAMLPSATTKMVGFDEELVRLMAQLTTDKHSLQIVPVVGIGGIGKTTLAMHLYKHKYVVNHFHTRAWVTISQDYSVREIILCLLHQIIGDEDMIERYDQEKLEVELHKCLFGRKYLIILDDIWSSKAWNDIRRFLPDNNIGSRILLTTRLSAVARTVGSCNPHEIIFLDEDNSWELLCATVYEQKVCPRKLEKLGKIIARSCQGLPLTITVIGGLLKMSPKTPEFWGYVADNVGSIIRNDGHCMEVLSLSYNHMPVYLKPCFLYMATLKEDSRICVSHLIKLWVAEGLLKPSTDRVLEEVAMENLIDLISRNLIMVSEKDVRGNIESCMVHDSLREFCLTEAQSENFLCLVDKEIPVNARRLVSRSSCTPLPSLSSVRSYICTFLERNQFAYGGDLLRVFHLDGTELNADLTTLVNLRYLESCVHWCRLPELLSSIALFWNLETLIIHGKVLGKYILPQKIWDLPNLKHLLFHTPVTLPDPTDVQVSYVRTNLQTLCCIRNFNCTDEVRKMIPSLKELSVSYGRDCSLKASKLSRCFINLVPLHKLEKLCVSFHPLNFNVKCFLSEPHKLTFSRNLTELNLSGSRIPWGSMMIVGSLPNIEVLRLKSHAFCGEEWNSTDGEFLRLKYLSIEQCYLMTWNTEGYHFPRLEHLILEDLELEEIPMEIGEAASLKLIELHTSMRSAVTSAKEILKEQQEQEN